MSNVTEKSLKYLDNSGIAKSGKTLGLQDRCDIAYSRYLLGLSPFVSQGCFAEFLSAAKLAELAGTAKRGGQRLNVHSTAYLLGTLNLASKTFPTEVEAFLGDQDWQIATIINLENNLPLWPAKYSHHSWRVSHWIGGTPSILKSLWRQIPEICRSKGFPDLGTVLSTCDTLIDGRKGVLRTYNSDFLQNIFRELYRLRHDPDAGEIGGIVHLHWINYAEGRLPYKANDLLYLKARKLLDKTPFMEKTPYCLDFDIVQIVRTSSLGSSTRDARLNSRALQFGNDICAFLDSSLNSDYGLHRLPGALATVHECAMICGDKNTFELGIPSIDIIREAFWI